MKLTLLKDHEQNGKKYSAGEVIEVTKEEYDFIMAFYRAERQELIKQVEVQEAQLEIVKKTKKVVK